MLSINQCPREAGSEEGKDEKADVCTIADGVRARIIVV